MLARFLGLCAAGAATAFVAMMLSGTLCPAIVMGMAAFAVYHAACGVAAAGAGDD